MSRKDIIGTRLMKCKVCKKWVQFVPFHLPSFRGKENILVCTCTNHDDKGLDVRFLPPDKPVEYKGSSLETPPIEIALQKSPKDVEGKE